MIIVSQSPKSLSKLFLQLIEVTEDNEEKKKGDVLLVAHVEKRGSYILLRFGVDKYIWRYKGVPSDIGLPVTPEGRIVIQ